jgi:hypothetical protein
VRLEIRVHFFTLVDVFSPDVIGEKHFVVSPKQIAPAIRGYLETIVNGKAK